jgi:protein-S-isoprenylcysteine O-methyltransferase Ste14
MLVHMSALSTPLQVSIVCWLVLEVGLAVRDVVRRSVRRSRDRGTRLVVAFFLGAAFEIGWFVRLRVQALDTPAPEVFGVAGVVVVWIGLAVRVWAVLALGGSFSTFVQVDEAQPVVTSGPYRWIRHPSYTGLLLICLGFGVGIGNWLSIVVSAVVPVLGLLPRIAVEEAELVRVLGERYRRYQNTTHRLLPRLW